MKEMQRLTKQEKLELLSMLEGDNDTYKMTKIMCLKYLKIYPSEKKFKLLVYKKLRDCKFSIFRQSNRITYMASINEQ